MNKEIKENKAKSEQKEARQNKQNTALKSKKTVKKKKNAFLKKYGFKIFFPVTLLFLVGSVLFVFLYGIRGVYVSSENENNFYEFLPFTYRSITEDDGEEVAENGSWKISKNTLSLTKKNESGKVTDNYKFSKDGFDTIFIDDIEYKRVSMLMQKLTPKIKVKIELTGGVLGNFSPKFYISSGSKLKIEGIPLREGYTFAGFYKSQYGFFDGEQAFDFDTRLWKNCTIFANWLNNDEYTISSQSGQLLFSDFLYAPDFKLLPILTEKETTVSGVYQYQLEGKSEWVTIDEFTRMPQSNIKIRRTEEYDKVFLLNLDANGGEVSESQIEVTLNSEFTLPVPTKDGCRFCGWYDSATGGARITDTAGVSREKEAIKQNQTVYAIWLELDKISGYAYEEINGDIKLVGCSGGVSQLAIPIGFTIIGDSVFMNSSFLTSVSIPASVTTIGNTAFAGSENLTNIILPDSLRNISDFAFAGLINLKKLIVSDGVISIGNSAFGGCTQLSELNLPDSIRSIGETAFASCTNLSQLTLPDSIKKINNATFGNSGLENIVLPQSVTNIETAAFNSCSKLKSITIPLSLTKIESYAFGGCNNLNTVYYYGNENDWFLINIDVENSMLQNATRYYYSEIENKDGSHWHYVDGVPTLWE